jgi:hypothetical protein
MDKLVFFLKKYRNELIVGVLVFLFFFLRDVINSYMKSSISRMNKTKKSNGGAGIGIGAAIGLAISFAFGYKSENTATIIGLGLSIGVAFGALIDFLNRSK